MPASLPCPICSKAIDKRGLRNHQRLKHGVDPASVAAARPLPGANPEVPAAIEADAEVLQAKKRLLLDRIARERREVNGLTDQEERLGALEADMARLERLLDDWSAYLGGALERVWSRLSRLEALARR